MDLLDFSDCKLYFEEPMPAEAERLIAQAASEYGEPGAEMALLRAHLLAPENLSVLVGLYRYYFYQHRLDDALVVGSALDVDTIAAGDFAFLAAREAGQQGAVGQLDDVLAAVGSDDAAFHQRVAACSRAMRTAAGGWES